MDLIYSYHAIENFDREEVQKVLKKWYRILKKGGILRVAVPDFEALIKVYLQYKYLNKILGPLYGKMVIKTPKGKNIIYYKTVYDFKSLTEVLKSVGLKNVYRYDWRKTIHKDYDDFSQAYIPQMDKEHGLFISLNVEAEK